MNKFDHNDLDNYKRAMKTLEENQHNFVNCTLEIFKSTFIFKDDIKTIRCYNWEAFKEEIASYCLNKEE